VEWLQADMVHVQAIAERGLNEGHVPLIDLQAMFGGIPALALDMVGLKDAAASMRTFTRAPRKGLPELFRRVRDLCSEMDKVYLAQSGKSAGSSAAAAEAAATPGDEVLIMYMRTCAWGNVFA
jgi:hypothetical protein